MKKQAFNPYLPSWEYIPDGEPKVFDGRVYLYGSKDVFGGEYCCHKYHVYSAAVDDLKHWTDHGPALASTDEYADEGILDGVPWSDGLLWAPDVVERDGWYYLFASKGSCCNHEKSSYRLVVARSRNIFGPYKGPDGQKMTSGSFGNVIMEGGGQFIGTGHCSQIVTDDAGQQWMAYHSYWNGNGYISRCLCIDRIDWTEDGWPWFPDASGSLSVFSVASPGTDVPVPAFH